MEINMQDVTETRRKMKNKGMSAVVTTLIIILLVIVALGIVFVVLKNVIKSEQETCEETYIMELTLDSFDWKTIDERVVDYYVIDKLVAPYYWDKLCMDLLEIGLNEILSQSDNLWLDTHSLFYYDSFKLDCDYEIYWEEEGEFYGVMAEEGWRNFNTEEILLAQEKRLLEYNKSLISVYWEEEFEQTILINDNLDYAVILNLKLNESVCI